MISMALLVALVEQFCVSVHTFRACAMALNLMHARTDFKTRRRSGSFNDWLVQLSPEYITRAIMSSKQVAPTLFRTPAVCLKQLHAAHPHMNHATVFDASLQRCVRTLCHIQCHARSHKTML